MARQTFRPGHLSRGGGLDLTRRGADSPSAKLNPESVRTIRESDETSAALARRFGVSQSTISRVRRGQSWKQE
jgi:transcriptional regulator with XRE-family HTH domain